MMPIEKAIVALIVGIVVGIGYLHYYKVEMRVEAWNRHCRSGNEITFKEALFGDFRIVSDGR